MVLCGCHLAPLSIFRAVFDAAKSGSKALSHPKSWSITASPSPPAKAVGSIWDAFNCCTKKFVFDFGFLGPDKTQAKLK